MSIINFITSKVFLKQLALAVAAIVVLCFIILKWLNVTTNHGNFETVPNLKGKSISVAKIELGNNNLVMAIQDSANYNPDFPKYAVIDQNPVPGEKVKENRKIYITLNPSGYRKIAVPNLVGKTFRQAKPTLESLGFQIGKISYVDDLGKDEVVSMRYQNRKIKKDELLPKMSTIDVVLGNGNR
ncbi:PASTA domain-containing protein [Lacinutrix neustonica]|uniref:PASTA domain-containing protein n=1 Tax=Lacinutrix neustonica TaxID=2980107 RepID=A0A9E8SF32_9FLAO|nr:PASTA domain-containing protein [Lacinutrix neustonica]WAC03407.1 PASTA domain-containing protein [Lacinutrix neustonica]